MVIKSDIILRGDSWNNVIDNMKNIFSERTHYSIFMLALSIGIMYDKRIDSLIYSTDEHRSVPRNIISNNDNGKLDLYFQAAILSTRTEILDEEKRLELAFADEVEFNKIEFLTEFANFGITKLEELIGKSDLETMDKIKNFCISSVEGKNFEINALPDELIDFVEF